MQAEIQHLVGYAARHVKQYLFNYRGAGDIHDIGKNNLSPLLTSYGFKAHDLGVDMPPSEFLYKALEIRPDIILRRRSRKSQKGNILA